MLATAWIWPMEQQVFCSDRSIFHHITFVQWNKTSCDDSTRSCGGLGTANPSLMSLLRVSYTLGMGGLFVLLFFSEFEFRQPKYCLRLLTFIIATGCVTAFVSIMIGNLTVNLYPVSLVEASCQVQNSFCGNVSRLNANWLTIVESKCSPTQWIRIRSSSLLCFISVFHYYTGCVLWLYNGSINKIPRRQKQSLSWRVLVTATMIGIVCSVFSGLEASAVDIIVGCALGFVMSGIRIYMEHKMRIAFNQVVHIVRMQDVE